MNQVSENQESVKPNWVLVGLSTLIAALIVSDAVSAPAMTWMHVYAPEDITSPRELLVFLRDLRIPIPPIQGIFEIVEYWTFGSNWLSTTFLYQLALIGAFVIAPLLVPGTFQIKCACALVSLVCLSAAVQIHHGNPQSYDIWWPLFLIAFAGTLSIASRSKGKRALCLLAVSGAFLSLSELTRPITLLFVPLALTVAYRQSRALPFGFVCFLVPVILLSGTWHAKLFIVNDGQILTSNHGGFNMVRCWTRVAVPSRIPPMLTENDAPLGLVRWENLNTLEHTKNSQMLTKAVIQFIASDPAFALGVAKSRIEVFTQPKTEVYVAPDNPFVIAVYKWIFKGALFSLLVAAGVLAAKFRAGLLTPHSFLILTALGSILIMALGEAGEEARFALSILPIMLMLMPDTMSLLAKTVQPHLCQFLVWVDGGRGKVLRLSW